MSDRLQQLIQIRNDLEAYVATFCPCDSDGKYDDYSGEKCNDALLMLNEAIRELQPGA